MPWGLHCREPFPTRAQCPSCSGTGVPRLADPHQLPQAPPEHFAGLKLVLLPPLTKAGQALQRLKLPLAFRLD